MTQLQLIEDMNLDRKVHVKDVPLEVGLRKLELYFISAVSIRCAMLSSLSVVFSPAWYHDHLFSHQVIIYEKENIENICLSQLYCPVLNKSELIIYRQACSTFILFLVNISVLIGCFVILSSKNHRHFTSCPLAVNCIIT